MINRLALIGLLVLGALPAQVIYYDSPFEIVSDNLELLYLMDDGTGTTVTDNSGNGRDATICGGSVPGTDDPTWATEGIAFHGDGGIDSGLTTVGGTEFFADGTDHWTVMMAAKGDNAAHFARAGTTTADRTMMFFLGSSLNLVSAIRGETTVGSISDTNWHTYTMLADADSVDVYKNDTLDFNGTIGTAALETTERFIIGARSNCGGFFMPEGTFAGAVAVYSDDLTTAQIDQNLCYFRAVMAHRGVTLPEPASGCLDVVVGAGYPVQQTSVCSTAVTWPTDLEEPLEYTASETQYGDGCVDSAFPAPTGTFANWN